MKYVIFSKEFHSDKEMRAPQIHSLQSAANNTKVPQPLLRRLLCYLFVTVLVFNLITRISSRV